MHTWVKEKKRKTINFKSYRTKEWWKGQDICLYIDLSPPQTAKTKIGLWCCKSKASICKQLIKNTKYERKKKGSRHLLQLPLGECITTFNLENVVRNHDFFMMAPNTWIPSTKTLQKPLRRANSATSDMVSILHPSNNSSILIQVHDIQNVPLEDEKAILVYTSFSLSLSLSLSHIYCWVVLEIHTINFTI